MNLNISRIEELRGPMPYSSSEIYIYSYGFIDGGSISSGGNRNEFTSTEERVIELVSDGLNGVLMSSWRDLIPLQFRNKGARLTHNLHQL